MTEVNAGTDDLDDIPDDVIATLSDYLDGTLPDGERAAVDNKLATDELWKRAHTELQEARGALSTLKKAHAPPTFTEDVTGAIHKRSAGRFFGKKTFGDRVPFGAILAIALVLLVALAAVLWSSQTGSLRGNKDAAEKPHPKLDLAH